MVRSSFFVCALILLLASSVSAPCQGIPMMRPESRDNVRACAPRNTPQRLQPVARTVSATVRVPTPNRPYCGPGVFPSRPMCPPAPAAAPPSRPLPVRVEVSVRPESCEQRRPVPVVYRDPGFMGPIIRHSIGLAGATVAAPFRVLEMLVPLDASPTLGRRCGTPPRAQACGYQRPPIPRFDPRCPPPLTRPAYACIPRPGCAPPGPAVAPLPPCAMPPGCGPFMPPAMVEREQEPPCAPQSLLGGVLDLPFRLLSRGRVLHDMGSMPPAR